MHIKSITLSNFRSFRQCTNETQPFSSKTNVIVGRNGTGKSNVLDAIQFVLLFNKFVTLRAEERQALLHDDASSSVISAYVEIVLDNSNGRLNVEGDEVLLRRTIGTKKDEFFVNRKRVQKTEVLNLLESAGFSKSNPYFIVQQGKVHTLCTMSDHERLVLLKEVAGTTVYDEKRKASITQMEMDEASIEKIDEALTYIEKRLHELEGEKAELKQYQDLDRTRRALEYTLYSTELKGAREHLDELEHMRSENVEELHELHEQARSVHDSIRSLELKMKQGSAELRRSKQDVEHYARTLTNQQKSKTQLSLKANELRTQCEQDELEKNQAESNLKILEKDIAKTEAELAPLLNKSNILSKEIQQLRSQATLSEETVQSIYGAINRAGMSKRDREKFLATQIKEHQSSLDGKQKERKEVTARISHLTQTQVKLEEQIRLAQDTLTQHRALASSLNTKLVQLKAKRDEHQADKVNAQRDLGKAEEHKVEAKDNYLNAQMAYEKTMPKATRIGLKHLPQVLDKLGIRDNECYGPVIANFKLRADAYQTAVEVAGGNALLHVIVDTDETASRILKHLEQHKLGRLTFLPLNILERNYNHRDHAIEYPESSDVCSLLEKCLNFDRRLTAAMKQVFGRKLLAKDWEVASQWSESTDLDCVTLDGELLTRKGAITGGWHDQKNLKLATYLALQSSKASLESVSEDFLHTEKRLHALEKSVAKCVLDVQRSETKRNQLQRTIEETTQNIDGWNNDLDSAKSQHIQCNAQLEALDVDTTASNAALVRFQEELANPQRSKELNDEQTSTIAEQEKLLVELRSSIEKKLAELSENNGSKDQLEALLNDDYYKRRAELEDLVSSASCDDANTKKNQRSSSTSSNANTRRGLIASARKHQLELHDAELSQFHRIVEKTKSQLEGAQQTEQQLQDTLSLMKSELDKLRQKDLKHKSQVDDLNQSADKLLNKRSMYLAKREMYMRKIQELGSLPSGVMLSQHSNESISSLMRKLDGTNKKLRKYSHVNKKAYDQFVNFNEHREDLLERKEELDVARDKLQELMDSLDRQKDEAIHRTFRGVSAHFKDVFSELVPDKGACGELIMRTDLEDNDDDNDTDEEDEEADQVSKLKTSTSQIAVSRFRGIGIKVRFSALGENYIMSQLSGGQKALVAMALIFAIQRCDPAPFYIFDELDQALDSTHRTAVAALIQRQANSTSNPTQFICTTFRPELVQVANKMYGISHQNKVSNIHSMKKDDGLAFVANLVTEEVKVKESNPEAGSDTGSNNRKLGNSSHRMDDDGDEEEEDGSIEDHEEEEDDGQTSPERSPDVEAVKKRKSDKKNSSSTGKRRNRRSNN